MHHFGTMEAWLEAFVGRIAIIEPQAKSASAISQLLLTVGAFHEVHIPLFIILYKRITLVVLEKFWIRTPNFGNPQSHFRSSSGLTMEPKCKIFGTHSWSIDGLAPVGSKVGSTGTTIGEKKMAEDLGNTTWTWRFGNGLLSYSLTSIWQVWQVFACILKDCRCKVWSCNF